MSLTYTSSSIVAGGADTSATLNAGTVGSREYAILYWAADPGAVSIASGPDGWELWWSANSTTGTIYLQVWRNKVSAGTSTKWHWANSVDLATMRVCYTGTNTASPTLGTVGVSATSPVTLNGVGPTGTNTIFAVVGSKGANWTGDTPGGTFIQRAVAGADIGGVKEILGFYEDVGFTGAETATTFAETYNTSTTYLIGRMFVDGTPPAPANVDGWGWHG